ncbi:SDR family oxidoreductase [Phytoactinopolyspora alkaliphila]|uniref:SDR family oxidoreductase n=1 Tax=Phytoactinopolyspora alkaliphila TaxID=1783498 RepID=A0A6N9YU20_9ACTN|nr:SDR family NAD(P)-dependent oxidoreductase [Phytoactinopolyspora alkaliphila]NED98482.1 SDR family oxidoreductase [Phytoactinopolyspora alkaliphila]
MAMKRALITGANRGIGRHLALGLASQGWSLGLLARNKDALEAVATECRQAGVPVAVAVADVTDPGAAADAVGRIADELGGLDLLVNNAGVIEGSDTDFLTSRLDETWRVIEVNVRGVLAVTAAVLRRMLPAGGTRVVNMNSGAGHKAMTGYTGYTLSKGALARFTTQLDAQYRGRGVRAFDVAPGHVKTDMTTPMPMHAGRTDWTAPQDVVDLIVAIGEGRLDELAGRFFRAGTDTAESLLSRERQIIDANARVLRLAPVDADDPVA